MFKRRCKIIFIRHGATIYSEQKRLCDTEDYPPLNQNGKDEMQLLAKWLAVKCQHVDKIYTSSSLRAIQSARIIAKAYEMDYEIKDGLYERKAGIWGGMTFDQIEDKYPDMLRQYHQNPYSYWPEGGESTSEIRERIEKILKDIVKENLNKTIFIVTHAGVIQSAIAMALNVSPESQGKIIIPTGSATQINVYDGWATLVYSAHKSF